MNALLRWTGWLGASAAGVYVAFFAHRFGTRQLQQMAARHAFLETR